jgi:hypothetical protein
MSEKPIVCKVCRHAERLSIDEALLRGETLRTIAKRFELATSTLHDHSRKGHIPKALAKAADAAAVASGDALLAKVLDVEAEVRRLATKAERGGDVRGALVGLRELTRILELLGRLSGELKSRTEVNIVVLPQWQDLQRRILAALAPYPTARAAVVAALAGAQASPMEVRALPAVLEVKDA